MSDPTRIYKSTLHAHTITNLAADRANIAKLRTNVAEIDSLTVNTSVSLPDGSLVINSSGAGAILTTQPSGGILTNDAFSLKTLTSNDASIAITSSNTEIDLAIGAAGIATLSSAGGTTIVTDGAGPSLEIKGQGTSPLLTVSSTATTFSYDNVLIRVRDSANNLPPTVGSASATAASAVAIGSGAAATSLSTVAIGDSASASDQNSIAIGSSNSSSGLSSVAIGNGANASGDNSTAVGQSTTASGLASSAVGSAATSSGVESTAIGPGPTASSAGAVAVGLGASASVGTNAIAIGTLSASSATSAIAVGNTASATLANGLAIGQAALATGGAASAIGNTAAASGTNSIAFGSGATASGTSAVAIGASASSTNTTTVAEGASANASGDGAIAIGNVAVASGAVSLAVGRSSSATFTDAIAIGPQALAHTAESIAIGSGANALASQTGAVVIGTLAEANLGANGYGVAVGHTVTVRADRTACVGNHFDCTSANACGFGMGNQIAGGTILQNEPGFVAASKNAFIQTTFAYHGDTISFARGVHFSLWQDPVIFSAAAVYAPTAFDIIGRNHVLTTGVPTTFRMPNPTTIDALSTSWGTNVAEIVTLPQNRACMFVLTNTTGGPILFDITTNGAGLYTLYDNVTTYVTDKSLADGNAYVLMLKGQGTPNNYRIELLGSYNATSWV